MFTKVQQRKMPDSPKATLAILDTDNQRMQDFQQLLEGAADIICFSNPFELYEHARKSTVDVVISFKSMESASGISLMNMLRTIRQETIFIFYQDKISENLRLQAVKEKVSDVFDRTFTSEMMIRRVEFLLKYANLHQVAQPHSRQENRFRLPLYKRTFDIIFSGLLILALSPFFLLIALLIKLESPGPVIYYSLRVGTGYRIFRFYKFRSMRQDADKLLKSINHLNQYSKEGNQEAVAEIGKCSFCLENQRECHAKLIADGKEYCEFLYQQKGEKEEGPTFIKIKNDPRITRIGRIIRNTSIDELPQLFNVLMGDMSIVGNRPLPLYEAEKLTTDQFSQRFNAPAGITGLWQISKRGKGKMTEEERIALDNQYAGSFSLWLDIQILFKTFSALIQKENV